MQKDNEIMDRAEMDNWQEQMYQEAVAMQDEYGNEIPLEEIDEALDAWQEQMYQETVAEMTKTEEIVPEKDLKPVKEAAKDMTDQMYGYRRMEQDCGHPRPHVWQEHAEKQAEITKDLTNCRKAYEEDKTPEMKQTAIEKARDSFEEASKAWRLQMQKLSQMYAKELEKQREENRRMQEKMQKMEETIKELRESARPVLTKEQLMVAAEALRVLQTTVERNRSHYLKEVRDHVSHTVQDTYHAIEEAPRRVKNAIKAKAFHVVESVLSKTTAKLNEASRQIEENRRIVERNEKRALARAKATPAKWRLKTEEKNKENIIEKEPVQEKRKRRVSMQRQEHTQERNRSR